MAIEDRDAFVGAPWHKHVPALVEAIRQRATRRAKIEGTKKQRDEFLPLR